MRDIAQLTQGESQGLSYILMDIDDTITTEGKLTAEAYEALWELHDAGLRVIPITGRPAGWCDLIARQWPVDGVVGENGALAYWEEDGILKRIYHPNAVKNTHPVLEKIKERVLREIPLTRVAQDQFARLFDLAIDFAEEEPKLDLAVAEEIKRICTEEGAIAKVSSIHVNTWMGVYSKLEMSERFLRERFGYDPQSDRLKVLFFGDSPNDEPMFAHFPLTVGVASVGRYQHLMQNLPTFITKSSGGAGFREGVDRLLGLR
ncbi:MAG: HAD-IIB family hydrolase [Sphaerochaeta sp.]